MDMTPPLSIYSRRIIAVAAVCAFICIVPLAVLYASGYRWTPGADQMLVTTGGLYVSSPMAEASLFVDGQHIADTGYFSAYFFVTNLTPGIHGVDVYASTTLSWHKEVLISGGRVARSTAFLVPKQINLFDILEPSLHPSGGESSSTATGPVYEYASVAPFFTSTSTLMATTSANALVSGNVALWAEGMVLVAQWRGDTDQTPDFFCILDTSSQICPTTSYIRIGSQIHHFDFFPGRNDVVIVATDQGVYALEIDSRPDRRIVTLYKGPGSTFRLIDGHIFIKTEEGLYQADM